MLLKRARNEARGSKESAQTVSVQTLLVRKESAPTVSVDKESVQMALVQMVSV
jgi:hypothetical protein